MITKSWANEWPDIVIIHGFMAKPELHTRELSPVTDEYLRAGFHVHVAQTPPIASYERHAQIVLDQILNDVEPGKTFMLDGHSQGGIVARAVAHKFRDLPESSKQGRELLAVKTIGAPNLGSRSRPNTLLDLTMRSWLEFSRPFLHEGLYQYHNAALEMTPYEMKKFNQKYPNIDGIQYASITNIDPRKGHSDRLVPSSSSPLGTEIRVQHEHPVGDHFTQVYKVNGKEKVARINGLALVEYSKQVALGHPPKGKIFNFEVPSEIEPATIKDCTTLEEVLRTFMKK